LGLPTLSFSLPINSSKVDIRYNCLQLISKAKNIKDSSKKNYKSKLGLFFNWLETNKYSPSIILDKKELTKILRKYINNGVTATSKAAWCCFITALNIVTNNLDDSYKLDKGDVPKFTNKVNEKFKH